MNKLLKVGSVVMVYAMPVLVFAQSRNGINSLLDQVRGLIAALVPIIIGFAVIAFLWGVLKYIIAKDEEAQKNARNVMLYGIIALFVMVSVWGLVNILGDTLNLNEATPPPPGIPGIVR